MTRISKRFFATTIVLATLLSSAAGCGGGGGNDGDGGGGTPPPVTRTTLTVSGNQIVTPAGAPIQLRGFQGLGAYPIPDNLYLQAVWDRGVDSYQFDPIADDILQYSWTDFDIQDIKRTGANVIRLWTRLHEIKRGPGQYSETALRLLENTINRFGEQGIYTILVMAGAGENNYEPQQRYLSRGINLWDPASSARADSIEVWSVLARRFAGNPHVAGYDVMNEPMPPSAEALHDYYVDTVAAIRAHDADHIIILAVAQGHRDTFQIGGDYDDDNIAVTFHFYEPHNFTLEPDIPDQLYPGTYNGKYWDRTAIEAAFDYAVTLPQLKGKPIYIGEFGAGGERDGVGGLEWTTDVLNAMNQRGLHYTYHQYRHSVHRGYWTRRPEVVAATNALVSGIMDGTRHYSDLTEQDKRELFMTELTCDKRPGIEAILTSAFNHGR